MAYQYWWTPGPQPRYNQFDHHGCAVGCGPVAWAMLFCWGDIQAETGNAYWAPRKGLYRPNGGRTGNTVAPVDMDGGVRNVIREIHGHVDTFCIFGSGATFPWDMHQASRYLSGRTGAWLSTSWNDFGFAQDSIRNRARDSIKWRRTPCIIGTGWLSHYPMAFGYAYQERVVRHCFIWCWERTVYDRWFYVNQGWGGSGNEWVPASTWFSGEIYP